MKLSSYVRSDVLIVPTVLTQAGTTDSTVFLDIADYEGCEILVTTVCAAGKKATVTVLKASDAAGTGKATTAVVSETTAPADAALTTLHKLDAVKDVAKRFIGVRVVTDDATAQISAVAIRYPGRYSDATMSKD